VKELPIGKEISKVYDSDHIPQSQCRLQAAYIVLFIFHSSRLPFDCLTLCTVRLEPTLHLLQCIPSCISRKHLYRPFPYVHGFQTPVRYPAGHWEEHDRRLALLHGIGLPPTQCVVGDGGGNHSSRPRPYVDSINRPIWPLPIGFAPRCLATPNRTLARPNPPSPPLYPGRSQSPSRGRAQQMPQDRKDIRCGRTHPSFIAFQLELETFQNTRAS